MTFRDREEAGDQLAQKLESRLKGKENILVLGLPRGGVIVARAIASKLRKPLDVLVVRKLGYPGHEELAMGAIGEAGAPVFNEEVISGVDQKNIDEEVSKQKKELERRIEAYRGNRKLVVKNKIIVIVDDGIATGSTVEAAVESAKSLGAKKVIVAVPVASPDSVERLKRKANEVIVLDTPTMFMAVGQFYEDFPQTTDEEVKDALKD